MVNITNWKSSVNITKLTGTSFTCCHHPSTHQGALCSSPVLQSAVRLSATCGDMHVLQLRHQFYLCNAMPCYMIIEVKNIQNNIKSNNLEQKLYVELDET